ncbi:TetR/AcrR family transcriptional regulator [Lactovum miscens]|uniref:AcrR family transcriptional regulator n=1 Tax=Lactovum miscens TaxID=190387 RepID=A0A841C5W0_9LACT|nr:TetR/AcrR family transcriptional regulator [Lactovum miscens]MBB5887835.1 AcrR family transcriptional regulator [Lactovum miscens]
MEKKAVDLRVRRTKKIIIQSFISLLRKKKFEKISIQEIADNAMINRATFYAHYSDKQALYDSLIDEFLEKFTKVLDDGTLVEGANVYVNEIEGILTRFYDFIRENPEVAQVIIDKSQDEAFTRRFYEIISERYIELFEKLEVREKEVVIPIEFVISYITAILVGTLKWWISKNSQNMSSDDYAHLIIKLISNGHLTVLGVNIDRLTKI